MATIIQISDSHIGASKTHFLGNWENLAGWLKSQTPDLIVHTGDVSLDGAGNIDDLVHSRDRLRGLGMAVVAVPGNHDCGDVPASEQQQPVDAERLSRWQAAFGPDRWIHDLDDWRLVGINSQLCGTGLPGEAVQLDWLADVLTGAAGQPVALFLHKPLFLEHPEEGDRGYWTVPPAARAPIMALLRDNNVRLVASGHLHRRRLFDHDGVRYAWGPSNAFVVGDMQQGIPGEPVLGAVQHDLHGDGRVDSRFIEPAGLQHHVIDEIIHEVYPRQDPDGQRR